MTYLRSIHEYANRIGLEKTKQWQQLEVTADHAGVTEHIVLCDAQISIQNLVVPVASPRLMQIWGTVFNSNMGCIDNLWYL